MKIFHSYIIRGLCLLFLGWAGGFSIYLYDIFTARPPSPVILSDVITVFTGGSRRIEKGFDLYHQKLAPFLLISGIDYRRKWPSHYEKDRKILSGTHAKNTVENARELCFFHQKYHWKKAYLVTSHYHLRRSLIEIRRFCPSLIVIPYGVTPSKGSFYPDYIKVYVTEFHKLMGASLRFLLESVLKNKI